MRNRGMVTLGTTVLCVVLVAVLVSPLSILGQEPARGGGGQGRGGGGGRGGAPPTNLQVLPKDFTRQQVVQVMQTFTMGLGVGCNYCHAEMEGAQPGANGQVPIDAASDAKQQKKTARVMMKMVADINNTLGSQLGKPAADVTKVQCITCHRGAAIPKTQ
ncbi:MAG TPA: c-type cytochrome [Terriglobia bacterium]|nr:c-type cytochrome [Terriglobia bacterium]